MEQISHHPELTIGMKKPGASAPGFFDHVEEINSTSSPFQQARVMVNPQQASPPPSAAPD